MSITVFPKNVWFAAAFFLAITTIALGDATTLPAPEGTLTTNTPVTVESKNVASGGADTHVDIGPPTAIDEPTRASAPLAIDGPTRASAPLATAPAATEPYRAAIEKMPIGATTSGADASPAASQPAAQSLTSGITQTGIGTAVQVGGALLVVIGLIFVGRALAKKYVPGAAASNGKNVIEILARYPLAKAQSLVMVRIGSQIVVLNQTKEASTSVLVIADQREVASILGQIQGTKPNSIQAGFNRLLANAQMDLERGEMPENDAIEARMSANNVMEEEQLDEQLDEMAAAKRQLMELRTQVRTIRENLK